MRSSIKHATAAFAVLAASLALPATPALAAPSSLLRCDTDTSSAHEWYFYAPSNLSGAVGRSRFVAVDDAGIAVFGKSDCRKLSETGLRSFFSAFPLSDYEGSARFPQVIYDRHSDRFAVTASGNLKSGSSVQMLAVSTSGSASGWTFYSFDVNKISSCHSKASSTVFAGSLGVNVNRWFFTLGENVNYQPYLNSILSIDKAPTLSGSAPSVKCFAGLYKILTPPVVLDGNTTAYFLSSGYLQGNTIRRYRLETAASGPTGDKLTASDSIPIPSWNSPPLAYQPNGQPISTGYGAFGGPTIQSGHSLWNVHTIKVGQYPRWRLYRLSTTKTTAP